MTKSEELNTNLWGSIYTDKFGVVLIEVKNTIENNMGKIYIHI